MNCLACSAMYVCRRSLPCDSTLRHRRFPLGPSILTSRASRFARVLDCAAGTLVPLLSLLGSALLLLGWCCRLLLLGLHAAGLLLLGACITLLRQKLRQRFTTGSVAIGHAGGGDDDDADRQRRGCRGNDRTRTKMSQGSRMATMTTRAYNLYPTQNSVGTTWMMLPGSLKS